MTGRSPASEAPGSRELQYLLFLVRAGEILGLSLDYEQTLRNVCAAAIETVADVCLLDLGRGRDVQLVAAAHRKPATVQRLREAGAFLNSDEGRPRHPVREVIETGRAILVESIDEAYIERAATSPEHAAFMREVGYRSMMIVPVVSNVQGVLGAITLVRCGESAATYDASALLFAEDLGRRCGVAISKSKLYSESVEIATRLQLSSLPRMLPIREGIWFDAYYEPAQAEMLIGGDWYDAFNLPDGRIGISIGDVTGHGVDAAAFMGSLRDALRTALYGSADLLRALDIADYLIGEEFPEGRYATAHLSIYDPQTRTLCGVAAGHPGPLVWDAAQSRVVDPFGERGLPLGMRRLNKNAETTCGLTLEPGSLVVYFTDGLLEWDRDYLAGEAALREAMMQEPIRSSRHAAKMIRRAVVRGKHQDDIALLTLQVDA